MNQAALVAQAPSHCHAVCFLLRLCSRKARERGDALGILRDPRYEHLPGHVVAESGEIRTVYCRAIDDGSKHDRHLFWPVPQRGIVNPAAVRQPTPWNARSFGDREVQT